MKPSAFTRLSLAMVVLLGLCGLMMLLNKYGENQHDTDRAILSARDAVEKQDWDETIRLLHDVPANCRDNPMFLRVLADYLTGIRAEPLLLEKTLLRLESLGHSRPDDAVWLCWTRLARGDMLAARSAWNEVPEALRKNLLAMKLHVEMLRKEGRTAEAEIAEDLLFKTFPDDPQTVLRMATTRLDSAFAETRTSVQARLWDLTKSRDQNGIMAIRALEKYAEMTMAGAVRLEQIAEQHPLVTPDDLLRIASLKIRLEPWRKKAIVDAAIQRHQHGSNDTPRRLAYWLAREKEGEKILSYISLEEVLNSKDLFSALAEGLAQQSRWKDLSELLNKHEKLPVSDARAELWKALASGSSNANEARNHLKRALRAGAWQKDEYVLLGVHALAEKLGMNDLALAAGLELASPGTKHELKHLEKCWTAAASLKDAQKLFQISTRQAALQTGNVALINRRDYMRLLVGCEIEVIPHQTVVPREEGDRTLLIQAMQAYRLGDSELAKRLIYEVQNAPALNTGERAVYAGLMATAGQRPENAFALAERISPGLLLPEEVRFLVMAL